MLEEHVSLGGELDAPGISEKKPGPQAFLQLSNGLADGRLAVIELLGRLRNLPCICYSIKNSIQG